jgi:hypothetical protein
MASSPDLEDDTPRQARRRTLRPRRTTPGHAKFLLRFPKDPELEPAVTAFIKGDYRETRRACSQLLQRDLDPDMHDAARELLRRLQPDRLVLGILWGSFVVWALLVLWAYGHQ